MTPVGLFDLPALLLNWLDGQLTRVFPVPLAIALWAVLGAVLCLELYRLSSPQRQLALVKQRVTSLQRELAVYDGELEAAWPLLSEMLGQSFKRVALVLPATLLSAYPAIALVVWMSNAHGYRFPAPGEAVVVEVTAPLEARWTPSDNPTEPPHIQAWRETPNALNLDLPVTAPVPTLYKRSWWNLLSANPAGYLPDTAPVDHIDIALPKQEIIAVGPSWLRGWESIFLSVLFIAALAYKSLRKIH